MDPDTILPTRDSRLKWYKTTLCLAYQSLGVVYGDLSISPIYVYKSTFSGRLKFHKEDNEILGVLSLVFWTLTLIPLCKYILFVLAANDNGEGAPTRPAYLSPYLFKDIYLHFVWIHGASFLQAEPLLCLHAMVGLLSVSYAADDDISGCSSELPLKETRGSVLLKEFSNKHHNSRILLLLVVLLGTSMVIVDGILTPSMSYCTVLLACMILVGLFALQHFGTGVVRAFSPSYVYIFFKKAGKDGWSSLGGIVLCITGAEAMFADLGHFSQLSIRIAFTIVIYPCLILAYMGESAYYMKHNEDLERSFYKAIPEVMFWLVVIIATLATVMGSQSIISATFSIISQCRALRYFPRVKVIHTSDQIHGQIYIPEVNWILMVFCLAIVVGFRDTDMIGNAYGLAVITVMFVTTCLMFLIIVMVWKRKVLAAAAFVAVFGSVELMYLSACQSPQRGLAASYFSTNASFCYVYLALWDSKETFL